jgi:hypothetical protein
VDVKKIYETKRDSFELKCLRPVKDSTGLVCFKDVDIKNSGK